MSSVKNNKSASPAGILNNVMGNNSNTGTAPGNISKNTNTSNLKKTNLQKHQNPPQPPTQKPGQVTEQNPGKNTNTQGTTNSKLLNKTKGQQQSNTTKQNQSMKQNQGPNTNVSNKQSNSNQKNLKMSTKSNISSISTTTGYTVSTNANNSSNYTRSSQDTVSHLFSTDTNITTNNFGDNSFPVTPSTAAPSSAPQSPSMSNYGSTAKRSGASPRTPQPNSPLSNNATKAREISIVSTHSEDPLSIFFSRQLDWSTKGVPEIMKNIDKRRTWTCPDMDWSATGIPKCFLPNDESNFKTLTSLRSGSDLNLNDLWKFSWNDKGLPLPKDNYLEKFIDPHKGNMVDWNRVRYWENVILDWNRKGIPEVFRKARYCTKNSGDIKIDRSKGAYNEKSPCKIDWNGNGMPEIFKKINPNKWEKKAKEEKNNSSNSNFNLSSESLIMDWNCSGLPKQLRPKFWTHYDLALDWSVNGMTTIMDQLPTAKSRMMSAKESLEHSICGSLDWSEKGVPQKFGNLMNRQLFSKSGDEMMSLNWCAKGIPKCFRTAIKNDNSMEKKFNCNSNLTPCYLKVDSRSQNRIAKDNRKLKRKQAHLKNVYRFDPHNKTRQALLSVQFDHFRRQLLHPSQLPSEYNLKHKQQFIQNTVPMLKEKNRRDQSREDDVTGCDWTESGIPKGLKHEFVRNEELRFDWSDKGIPKMFNVGGKFNNNNKLDSLRDSDDMDWILIRGSNQSTKNRESNYEAAKEKQQLEEYWDNLVVDWSGVNNNKGVPLGKRQLDDYKIDWSCKGIPKLLDNAHFKCRHGSSYMKAGNSFHKDSQIIHIQSDEIMSMTSGSSKSTPKQMSPKSTPKRKSAGFQKHQDTNLWISVDAYQNHVNSKKNNNNSSSSIATSNKSNNSWVNLSSGHISNTSTSPPGSHASAESLNSENMNNNNNHSKKNKKGNHHHHHNDKHHKNLDTIQQHQKTPDSQIPKNNNNIQKVKGPATPISTVSTQDPSKARLNSKSGRSGLYTALEKRELFWAKQLDWSSTGIPQGFEVLRSQRAKEKEFASSKYNFRYREETDHNMFIDWSNCGKHKMPTQFREFAPSCWGALKGRKHFFNDDTFTIDWNMNGLPKMLYDNEKNPLCRDYQYDPMIMDWNEKGMPMEFRKINNERTSGRKAAIEYPIINWNASGIPKRYDQIANNGASRRGEWDDQIQCQWAEEGLPIVTVSGSSGKFSNSTMSKQINMNSLKGVEEYEEPCQLDFSQNGCLDPFKSSIYDNLTIDWTQTGCLDNSNSSIHQEGKKLRARTRFNGKTKQQNRRDLDNCNMEITYNMIDGDNTAGYNRRKNRCWNGENQQVKKPGYVWTQDNEIKPKLFRESSTKTKMDGKQSYEKKNQFSRSYKMGGEKNNTYQQTEEICYINWSKNGIDLWKTVHKQREPYCLDWNSNGIPGIMERADFHPKGYIYDNTCDWSTSGAPPKPRYHNNKGRNGSYNQSTRDAYWILKNGVYGQSTQHQEQLQQRSNGTRGQLNRNKIYESVDWASKGLPKELKEGKIEEGEKKCVDWSSAGIPWQLNPIDEKYANICVDWNSNGLPKVVELTKKELTSRDNYKAISNCQQLDWSCDKIPYLFQKVMYSNNNNYRSGSNSDMFESINWNRSGVPLDVNSLDKWEYLSLDWSCKGLPWGGMKTERPYKEFLMDWSQNGIPKIINDHTYFNEKKRAITESDTVSNSTTAKPKLHLSQSRLNWYSSFSETSDDILSLDNAKFYPNFKKMNKSGNNNACYSGYGNHLRSNIDEKKNDLRGMRWQHRMSPSKNSKRKLGLFYHLEERKKLQMKRRLEDWDSMRRKKAARWEKDCFKGEFGNLNDSDMEAKLKSKKEERMDDGMKEIRMIENNEGLWDTTDRQRNRDSNDDSNGPNRQWQRKIKSENRNKSASSDTSNTNSNKSTKKMKLSDSAQAQSATRDDSNQQYHDLPCYCISQISSGVHHEVLNKKTILEGSGPSGHETKSRDTSKHHRNLWELEKPAMYQKSHRRSVVMQKSFRMVRRMVDSNASVVTNENTNEKDMSIIKRQEAKLGLSDRSTTASSASDTDNNNNNNSNDSVITNTRAYTAFLESNKPGKEYLSPKPTSSAASMDQNSPYNALSNSDTNASSSRNTNMNNKRINKIISQQMNHKKEKDNRESQKGLGASGKISNVSKESDNSKKNHNHGANRKINQEANREAAKKISGMSNK